MRLANTLLALALAHLLGATHAHRIRPPHTPTPPHTTHRTTIAHTSTMSSSDTPNHSDLDHLSEMLASPKMIIAPALATSNVANLGAEVQAAIAAGADAIHVNVMGEPTSHTAPPPHLVTMPPHEPCHSPSQMAILCPR